MSTDFSIFPDLLEELLTQIASSESLRSEEVPNIDLYMDQVTTFMDKNLGSLRSADQDKLLTKTMINNYTKNKLLPPPNKKKYSREHLLLLVFIYYFKNIMPLQDIQALFAPLIETAADDDSSPSLRPDIRAVYDEVTCITERSKAFLTENINRYREEALSSFKDSPEADRKFLQFFTLISLLCYDASAKKEIIGKMIDELMHSES